MRYFVCSQNYFHYSCIRRSRNETPDATRKPDPPGRAAPPCRPGPARAERADPLAQGESLLERANSGRSTVLEQLLWANS